MRVLHLLPFSLAVAGILLLAWGLPREGGELYFVVVVPVFVLRGPLSTLGAFLLFFGLILGLFSFLRFLPARLLRIAPSELPSTAGPRPRSPDGTREPEGERRTEGKVGGVLLLGPIPIVFGSNAKVTTAMLILALALTTLLILLFL